MATAHEVDFRILGSDMQFVEVELDPGESTVAEAGSMMYMTPGIEMETIFGDGSGLQRSGVMGALLGAGKRLVTGESLFMTVFTNQGSGKQQVAFAAPYPGKILPLDLKQLGGELVCQKDSFLCAARGVSIGIAFQRRMGVGLFGGEGFIMQRLTGDGLTFVHAGGTVHPLELRAGEMLRVDTGCLVALQPSVKYEIEYVGKIKIRKEERMDTQTYANHRYSPVFWNTGFLAAALALSLMLWATTTALTLANVTLLLLAYATFTAVYNSRRFALKLQDRVIRLEMQTRLARLGREADLARLSLRQIIALRFASDAELPGLLQRAAAENMTADQIKRAITSWQADLMRT